jgi:Uma2 family endonuclease
MAIAKPMTATQFEAYASQPENAQRRLQLINGEVVEKMPTQLHAYIAALLATFLTVFTRQYKLGWVLVEARYCLPNDDANDLIPDVSFVSKARGSLVAKGPAPYMPDLAIEVKSPDDTLPEMRDKATYYLTHGTRLVWLVYPEKRVVIVMSADTEAILNMDDMLSGGEVLPHFEMPVRDIFPEE